MMLRKRGIKFSFIILCLVAKFSAGNERCVVIGGACPPEWTQWEDKCYKVTDSELTWADAKQQCVKMGGVMVAPHSQEEMDFILSLGYSQFWINCNNLHTEGLWTCQEGSTDVGYRNWRDGWAENGGTAANCAAVPSKTGLWISARCDGQRNAICKRPMMPALHH